MTFAPTHRNKRITAFAFAVTALGLCCGSLALRAFSPANPPRTGIIAAFAGTGVGSFSGDGLAATQATLYYPGSVAIAANGDVYVADTWNSRVRLIAAQTGVMTTVAGTGSSGSTGDGGSALSATLMAPASLAIDQAGNLYIADSSAHRIRKITNGVISTIAGTGTAGFSGDGGVASAALLNSPNGMAFDPQGNLYVADTGNRRIRRITPGGNITTFAGSGNSGYNGEVTALQAGLNSPVGVAVDAGNVYIADSGQHRIRKVSLQSGMIATIAGTGISGFSGEAGAATQAKLSSPAGIALSAAGDLYIADSGNYRVRKLAAATGILETIAGNGRWGAGQAGVDATTSALSSVASVAVDPAGNVLFVDRNGHRVWRVSEFSPTLTSTTYAGSGDYGYNGDGPATTVHIRPIGLALDVAGNLYVSDQYNNRVRKVAVDTGQLTTAAGGGPYTYPSVGDGGAAGSARLSSPAGLAIDLFGNIYIADSSNYRVRKVDAFTARISTIAGTGEYGFSGDGGSATAANMRSPSYLAVDASGNVYVSDYSNYRVRKITPAGLISTVAGNGISADSGDGGPAAAASLREPAGLALDGAGNLFIADAWTGRIRKVSAGTGIITAFAGGSSASSGNGDGGPAILATLNRPQGLAFDSAGNLYIAEGYGNAIRKVAAGTQVITTVAGGTGVSYDSPVPEGAAATTAGLNSPTGVAVDRWGNIYVADSGSYRVRKLSVPVAAPIQLTAMPAGPNSARLSWPSAGNVVGYNVKRSQGTAPFTTIASGVQGLAYVDTGLTRGARYRYVISALYGQAESANSNEASVTLSTGTTATTDFDLDGRSDLTVYRPADGRWFTLRSSTGYDTGQFQGYQWGLAGDRPVRGDFDGDSRQDIAVYRPSNGEWFILDSSRNFNPAQYRSYQWGLSGDVPVPADYDGDAKTDIAVYRPASGEWFLRLSTQGYSASSFVLFQWGLPGDIPLLGDFDGDNRTELTVYRPGTGEWFIRYSTLNYSAVSHGYYQWGLSGDQPLVTDFDGDGRTDVTVYRPSTGEWFVRQSTQNYNANTFVHYQWGLAGDSPVIGDFDNDRRTDLAVYRTSTGDWFLRLSGSNYNAAIFQRYQWGLPGDTPVLSP